MRYGILAMAELWAHLAGHFLSQCLENWQLRQSPVGHLLILEFFVWGSPIFAEVSRINQKYLRKVMFIMMHFVRHKLLPQILISVGKSCMIGNPISFLLAFYLVVARELGSLTGDWKIDVRYGTFRNSYSKTN